MQWAGADVPTFSSHLGAPPKHEWLELVKHWNAVWRAPVWFVADPHRTDLASSIIRSIDTASTAGRWPIHS